MRNLRNIQFLTLDDESPFPVTATAWDPDTDGILYATGPSEFDDRVELKRWSSPSASSSSESHESPEAETLASWDAGNPLPSIPHNRILNLHYLPDLATAVLVFAGGDIYVVRSNAPENESNIEIVGSVDAGLYAAAWSPDEELLCLVTRAATVVLMTREFEPLATIEMSESDLQASKHVNVGWGKAETQFRGKGARAALRDPTMPEKVDEGIACEGDEEEKVSVSWRGDGAYVALNSRLASMRRVVRVYSREGELDSVSEPVDYLEPALSWRPAGNLIAGVRRTPENDKPVEVVFFERNGLRHGQFPLRLEKEDRNTWASGEIQLYWNSDSSVLAVSLGGIVQLWTMGNYHWYLKQEIVLSREDSVPTMVKWHPEQALNMCLGREGRIHRLGYVSHVSRGPMIPPKDNGIVGVIDGKILKLTPLSIANVPPPMAYYEFDNGLNIIDISIFNRGEESLVAVLSASGARIYKWDFNSNKPLDLMALAVVSNSDTRLQQIVFVKEDAVAILASAGAKSVIERFSLNNVAGASSNGLCHIFPCQEIAFEQSRSSDAAFFTLQDGQIMMSSMLSEAKEIDESSLTKWAKLPSPPSEMEVVLRKQSASDEGSILTICATRGGGLYANERLLAPNCTSFAVTSAHIIFTTSSHMLKFVHLTEFEALEVPPDTPEVDERCRAIERGARLVTVMPSKSAVVLQMPRGNIETIYPRALVLAEIRKSVDESRFKKALLTCRRQRVDMNILYDYKPAHFMANVSVFIEQVQKIDLIDLFLSSLRNEDTSQTMYKETLNTTKSLGPIVDGDSQTSNSKVNSICDSFLNALMGKMSTNLQNVITAHVCKLPPDLESGLLEVSKLQSQGSEQAERAVEYICFLADANKLYDTALGMYDLRLTVLVAQQSQKDPREYIPFLQKLEKEEPLRRKFNIDNHLGRIRKCLSHLQEMGEFEELKDFTVKHELYEDSLTLYRYQEPNLNQIMVLYADYLSEKSRHKDAGIAYEYLHKYAAAAESYRLAHMWKECLACAALDPSQKDEIKSLAQSLAISLVELKDFHAAATVHLEYLADCSTAVQLFCRGYHFADASRVAALHSLGPAGERILDTGLAEGMATITELLAECKNQLAAQVPRLRELREKRAQDPLSFYDAGAEGDAGIPDNVSLAATDATTAGGTLFTRYTNISSGTGLTNATNSTKKRAKSARKEERKRARGKKGSVYEEEYLVNSIGRLIERVNSVNEDVERLVVGLMRRCMRERARAVEAAMLEVVEACQGCIDEVYELKKNDDPEIERTQAVQSAAGPNRVVPTVRAFKKLGVLGQ